MSSMRAPLHTVVRISETILEGDLPLILEQVDLLRSRKRV